MSSSSARLARRAAAFVPSDEQVRLAFRAEVFKPPWWSVPLLVVAGTAGILLPGEDLFGWAVFSVAMVIVLLSLGQRRIVLITRSAVIVAAEPPVLALWNRGALSLVVHATSSDLDFHRYASRTGWARVRVAEEEMVVVNDRMGRLASQVAEASREAQGA